MYKDLIEERERGGPAKGPANRQVNDRIANFEKYLRPQHMYQDQKK
jgi:hypothetical protein